MVSTSHHQSPSIGYPNIGINCPGTSNVPASKRLTWRRAVVYLSILVLLALALISRPHPVFFCVGAVFIALGEAVRVWGTGHLEKNQRLVTSGPYAHVKNPLYLGTLLIMIGFAAAATHPEEASLWVLCGLLPFGLACYFFYYFPKKMQVEYDRLRRRFGEEAESYIRSVPDLVPRLARFQGDDQRWRFERVVLNSELETVGIILAALALIGSKFFWHL